MPSVRPTEEAWKTFAAQARDVDPGVTLTVAREAGAGERLARSLLPRIPVAASAAAEGTDFVVSGVLGEGGMGRVLLAHQRSLHRDVAVKVLKADEPPSEVVDGLFAEAVITGSLEHPNVVPVHALGIDERGRPVLVMKRIEGVSWKALARDPEHAGWATVAPDGGDRLDAHLEILMAACNALHFAHSRGIIHRDLKLGNVMIGSFGEVYVVDWGVALHVPVPERPDPEPGALSGTPAYMAPEMVRGDPSCLDARTDVYLLGATLHAALTGHPRHRGESLLEVLLSARESLPYEYGPDVPAELGALCNRAMSADPAERFPSALDLRRRIASFRRHRGSIALSEAASKRLAEVRALGGSGAARRVHALLTECRFGFTQALQSWPENAAARAGREAALALMIEHEISQRDVEGARGLHAELESRDPELLARIEELAADLAATAEREARLRALEHDHDLRIGSRAQLVFVAAPLLIDIATNAYLFRHGYVALGPRDLLAPSVVATAAWLVVYLVVRRRLRTEISRKALTILVLTPVTWVVHRFLSVALGGTMPLTVAVDDLIALFAAAALGTTLIPRLGWLIVPGAVLILPILRWPEQAILIHVTTLALGLACTLLVWGRAVKA